MAQFRTTSDILDEILQKSGEPTNGNSPYESLALTYANKVHQAIVGGGNIFSTKVDEAWTWARAKHPIVLELEPAITFGTVSVTNEDVNITFSDAPAQSVEGWHLQITGRKTVYKVMEHSAGVNSAVLDSGIMDETGSHSFRLFKLDYEVMPKYLYIDSYSDRISFSEDGGGTHTISLTHGSYTPSTLINHVAARMTAAGSEDYSGTYDSVLKYFTISGGANFSLLGATGNGKKRSALPLLGFDRKDYSGSDSYESTYIVNGVSRLIEPFKVFTQEYGSPFIEATDPIGLENDYPLAQTAERLPQRFAQVSEDEAGTITVRFSSYPRNLTKVTIDWVPVPKDLQDNDLSYPLIPRKDIDVLIHGASAFILFDKEDTKWKEMYGLCKAGLEAMEKKNRSELFRTGSNFAQIIPRADLANKPRKLRYGYTVETGASPASISETAQTMIKVTKSYSDFQTGALTNTVTARSLPANRSLFSIILKHTASFQGGSISSINIEVGISGDSNKFIASFNPMQAVADDAQTAVLLAFYPATATDITITMTAVGDNLSALTAGSLNIYFQETVVE